MNRRLRYLAIGFVLATIVSLAVAVWLYETRPGLQRSLVHEAGFVQSATAALFFAAFLVGLLSLSRVGAAARRAFAWIPVAAAFGWLEELSYGEALFHLHPPILFHKHVDSLHSLIEALLLPLKRSDHADLLQSLLWVTLGFLAIRHRFAPRLEALARRHPAWLFALLAAGLVLLAQLIDLRVLRWRDSHVMEEILELDGAAALLIAAALSGRVRVPAGEPVMEAGIAGTRADACGSAAPGQAGAWRA